MAVNRILYFYAVLLSFALFVLFDLYLFHLLFVFLLLLPLASLLAALPVCFSLRYEMHIEDDIVPKGSCAVDFTADNKSPFPCAFVLFLLTHRNALGRTNGHFLDEGEDSVRFSLAPRRPFTLRLPVKMAYCGRVDFAVRRVCVCDMLGLFCLPVPKNRGRSGAGSVYVLPELQVRSIETDEAADLGLDSSTYSTEKPGNDPSEIFQLRDYRPGDARHSVHWKLSARMDRLIVRDFGLPLNPSLHFLLELRADASPAAAEQMLGTMLAFSEYLMAREIIHNVSWIGEEGVLRTVAVTGADALASVLHELLALPGQADWSTLERYAAQAAPQSETHLVYLIAGTLLKSGTDEGAERLLSSLTELGVCRRMTLMPERCTRETVRRLRNTGCEVQLLDGRIPALEPEEAL